MKKSTKLLALLLSVIMLVTILAGCSNSGGNTSTGTSPASPAANAADTSTAADGGLKLNLSIPEEVNSVDPAMNTSMWSMQMICLTNYGLMSFGQDGEVTYGLADSYKLSDDGLTYTFHIRDNAFWSNGDKVTANDFLFAWKRVTNPESAAPAAFALGASGVKNGFAVAYGGAPMDTLGISAPDASTFVVTLDAPRSYFLYLTALAAYLMPTNEKYFDSCGDQFGKDKDHYLSCGPYVFSDWEVGGSSYTLVKNDKFYDAAKVTVDQLNFQLITDSSQQIMGWDNKSLDFLSNVSGDYVAKYANDPGMVTLDQAALFFLSFNTTDTNLSNKNLRMALSLAVDKKAIVDSILNNGSRVADYAIPAKFAADSNGVFFRDNIGNPTYNTMDKAKAATYWEAAKKDLGVSSLSIDLLYNEDSILSSVSAFLQSEWQKALPGLTINLVKTTYTDRVARMGKQDYQIGLTRWYADYPDASTYLDMWTTTSQMNYGKYSNADYDALDSQMNGELALKEQERIKVMAKMESIVLGDAAICPLYQMAACNLENPDYNWVKYAGGGVVYQWVSKK